MSDDNANNGPYPIVNPNARLNAKLEAARLTTANPADERMKRRRAIPPKDFGIVRAQSPEDERGPRPAWWATRW
jgi:hypothetical protein